MEVKDILRNARIRQDMTMKEVADKVGVSEGTISRWESGEIANMKRDKILLLAKALEISPALIMGWDVKESVRSPIRIPVLGRVAAGIPLDAVEEIIDWEEITPEMAADGEYFALQIHGDSMEPKISNGDIVIVRKQEDADDGDYVIALVNGNDAVCKRLKKYQDGIALVSTNPAYSPLYFSKSEVNYTPVQILGKVKELRAKF